MGAQISAIEYYFPGNILSNEALEKRFPEYSAKQIEEKVGIKNRHVASENETALDLAFLVGKKILENFDRELIDFLMVCTQSSEYYLPTGACILQEKLNLRTDIGALDFNLGCSGFIYGLSLAKGLIKSKSANHILLITTDTYTKYIHKKDRANLAIFGDGAAATIISPSEDEKILKFVFGTDGRGYENLIVPNGGARNKYDENALEIEDAAGNIRSPNNLFMNGPEIFKFTIETVPAAVKTALGKNNFTLDNINYVIFHQANSYILNYLRKKIKIPKEKFYIDLKDMGNTVSSTIPIAIKQNLTRRTIKKGDILLLVGFGVGYSWGAGVIQL